MKIRLVVFDVDGTLTTHDSSWWRLHEVFNTREEGQLFYDQYFAGEIDYQRWADLDAGLWKGQPLSKVLTVAKETQLMPGAIETIDELKKNGIHAAILSGGLDILALDIAGRVGIEYVLVNELDYRDGFLTGKVGVKVGWGGKAKEIEEVCAHFGVSLEETAFVGDGTNDISVLKIAGLSIAFNPSKEEVAEAAMITIRKKDLREILPHVLSTPDKQNKHIRL